MKVITGWGKSDENKYCRCKECTELTYPSFVPYEHWLARKLKPTLVPFTTPKNDKV